MFPPIFRQMICNVVIVSFTMTMTPPLHAQEPLVLPAPGIMVSLSPEFTPAHLKGITIHPENALKFDFIIHRGDDLSASPRDDAEKQHQYKNLIKYFLASLAVPDENQWVNLSPYEKDRIIKEDFGKTEMGRDLLSQDYLLKQITASLIYPEQGLGQKFWDRVYEQAYKQYGNTNIPVNTFNKVWIVPDSAVIYEKGNTAYVLKNHLKVLLEADYLAMQKANASKSISRPQAERSSQDTAQQIGTQVVRQIILPALEKEVNEGPDARYRSVGIPTSTIKTNEKMSGQELGSKVLREIIIPILEKEVNEGKNFAMLRQVYSAMVLAAWYKRALKESLLGKIYADKAKVKGIDQNPKNNEAIYQRYLQAFKKGVYNYIKEDTDQYTHQTIPRKYFSGGTKGFADFAQVVKQTSSIDLVQTAAIQDDVAKMDMAAVALEEPQTANARSDAAMRTSNDGFGLKGISGYRRFLAINDLLRRISGPVDIIRQAYVSDSDEERLGDIKLFEEPSLPYEPRNDRDEGDIFHQIYRIFNSVRILLKVIKKENSEDAIYSNNALVYRILDRLSLYLPFLLGRFNYDLDRIWESNQTGWVLRQIISLRKEVVSKVALRVVKDDYLTFQDGSRIEWPVSDNWIGSKGAEVMMEYLDEQLTRDSQQYLDGNYDRIYTRTGEIDWLTNEFLVSHPSLIIELGVLKRNLWSTRAINNMRDKELKRILRQNHTETDAQEIEKRITIDETPKINGEEYSWNLRLKADAAMTSTKQIGAAVLGLTVVLAPGQMSAQTQRGPQAQAVVQKAKKINKVTFPHDQGFEIKVGEVLYYGPKKVKVDAIYRYPDGHVNIKLKVISEQNFLTDFIAAYTLLDIDPNGDRPAGLMKSNPSSINAHSPDAAMIIVPEGIKQQARFYAQGEGGDLLNAGAIVIKFYFSVQSYQVMDGEERIKKELTGHPNAQIFDADGRNMISMIAFARASYPNAQLRKIVYIDDSIEYILVDAAMTVDQAAVASPAKPTDLGGIDMNAANLNLQIRRDGRGVPLPLPQQDLEHINLDGLVPIILEIKPAMATPLLSELQI